MFGILITSTSIFAQSFCGPNGITYGKESYHTAKNDMVFKTELPLVLNIFFHDYQTVALTEEDYLRAVADLNIHYNQFNIFFKYRGFELVNNSATPQSDMLNVHIQNIAGGTALNTSFILVSFTAFQNNPQILLHEIGHIFGLLHTHQGTTSTLMTFDNPIYCEFDPIGEMRTEGWFPSFTSNSENVTRDPTDVNNYNADEAGDFVVDTFAAFSIPNFCRDLSTETSYYIYSNEVKDNSSGDGIPYENIDSTNIMLTVESETDYIFLRDFTSGQGVRMRETIINEAVFGPILQDVSVLYEPYVGEYYYAGPITTESPVFQPGFDYQFVECSCECPQPIDYSNINFTFNLSNVISSFDSNESSYSDIVHPNHSAIRIIQLEDGGIIQPRRCYDNFNKAPSGGSVTKFNDDVFNTNVTITPKDSIGINHPNLINELPSGLYVIDKNYDDGSQTQTTIIKEND